MLKESTELYMTLVQNRQRLSSGNKNMNNLRFSWILFAALAIASCAPKGGTLRSPDYKGNVGSNSSNTSAEEIANKEESVDKAGNPISEKSSAHKKFVGRNISLVLPFQLNVNAIALGESDVKRAALALDFYQGFQMGLNELAKKGANFYLNVLDSKDNDFQNATLAQSDKVKESSLIVGPIYPKEIRSFGSNLTNKEVLQINPLAASMPTEFNLPNLVSLTPPIRAHMSAIALEVAKQYGPGDVILLYNTADTDGKQFLSGMLSAIKQSKPTVEIYAVSSVTQLNEKLSSTGNNIIVTGTTDKFQIKTLLSNLENKATESYYTFKLFGHPLWARYDFDVYTNFSNYIPTITSESHLKPWHNKVKEFKTKYFEQYGVNPSDNSYKGYDAATYFGGLINKYNTGNIQEHLLVENFTGIFSSYKFKYNAAWGYGNEAVTFQVYDGKSFSQR